MMKPTPRFLVLALISAAFCWPDAGGATTPTKFELGDAARWATAKFKAKLNESNAHEPLTP